VASLVRRVENLVVEDGKVKGKAETDRVSGSKISLGNLGGSLVGLEGGIGRSLAAVTNGELGQITVVVSLPVEKVSFGRLNKHTRTGSLHLVVEDLGLASLGGGDQVLVENLENVLADLGQLSLNLLAVFLDQGDLGLVALGFLFLLNRGDDPPRGTASTNDVFVGD
jgi:hypothetical protein